MRLKSYQLLILILIGSLLVSAIVGGVAKMGMDAVVTRFPSVARHAGYTAANQTYDFGKPFRHMAMGMCLVALIVFARRLELLTLLKASLQLRPGRSLRELGAGIAIGLLSIALIVAISALCGARTFRAEVRLTRFLAEAGKIVPLVAVMSVLEEVLFRGFVLQSFLKDLRAPVAIFVTSFAFAALHFLDVKVILPVGLDLFAGFHGLAIFSGMVADPLALHGIRTGLVLWPKFLGLALFGILLSCAYVWTRSLYLPIGIHAGGVFALRASRLIFQRNALSAQWFFGDGLVITGFLGVLSLFAVTLLLYLIWGRSQSASGT